MTVQSHSTAAQTTSPEGDGAELLDNLRLQVGLYEALETLSQKQRELVSRQDTAPLLSLLATRQRLTTKLHELGERINPARRRWDNVKASLGAAQRSEAETLLEQVRGHLRRLIEQDESDARMLSARRQTVGDALGAVRQNRSAIGAYRKEAGSGATRLDQTHTS